AAEELFEQAPGTKIRIDLAAMPPPYQPPSPANPPRTIDRPKDATLRVPAGFSVNIFAEDLDGARNVKVAPNGDVFLAQRNGQVRVLRDGNGDGKAETIELFAEDFANPHGLDFLPDAVLIGDLDAVWSIPYQAGDLTARAERRQLTADGALGDPSGHATRNVVIHPDRSKFYVAIGSRGNINEEPEPRATVQEFKIDGSGQRTFATGLRNAVGIAFAPGTTDLYTVVNERDGLADELVPDYLTKVVDGGFYGWPYSYMGSHPQPRFATRRPDLVAKAIVPDTPFRSHSAPVEMAFSTGDKFPVEWRGGAFVALHGSWNAAKPRGYHVVYVPWQNGKAADYAIVFASGFWHRGADKAEVWGRPSGVAMAKDGSLLIADDVANIVWRVSHSGK
ncbi:MAG: PQQ-dependent sugar dehydrogenase, partial [Rhodospirillaceae bacterium]|nr:PQQ-dependent sugar dehydrogenase [Rhodospirillaceae bacterium]